MEIARTESKVPLISNRPSGWLRVAGRTPLHYANRSYNDPNDGRCRYLSRVSLSRLTPRELICLSSYRVCVRPHMRERLSFHAIRENMGRRHVYGGPRMIMTAS